MWKPQHKWVSLAVVVLVALAALACHNGAPAAPEPVRAATRYDSAPMAAAGEASYQDDVRPILERRCVVCHGCFDAPCQLKLSNWSGIARGLSKAAVYDGSRLKEAPTTRLGIDATKASQWRARGFSPVLDEADAAPRATAAPANGANNPAGESPALQGSLLWQTLALKRANPLPATPVLAEKDFDFSMDRNATCPRRDEFNAYARAHPLAGMPYGLPALDDADLATVQRWLQAGAPDKPVPALPATLLAQMAEWERFLNGDSLRQQLMGRYLYEHLFLGTLVFDGDTSHQRFKLVRAANPPGQQPVVPLATRRPFDDPGIARPWYRLVRDDETLLAKTHMPYVLSAERLARWQQWFLAGPDTVTALPDYQPDNASNPFRTFEALPLQARYRFLLDDAGYFIMNFIKGPVCRGQIALNVIRDRFWVFFVDPAQSADDDAAQATARAGSALKLPAAEGSDAGLLAWRGIARSEDELLRLKTAALEKRFGGTKPITLDFIWQGDGHNPNAALTVFRHFDSATVVQGLVGEPPKTAWVIGYPLLERIYYLLVAGFDVYGNVSHQLQTRLYMDFLRMEGEASFLSLLPRAARLPLRDQWYVGASNEVKQRVLGGPYRFDAETGVPFPAGVPPQQHLYHLLQQRLKPVLGHGYAIDATNVPDANERKGLQQVAHVMGASLQWVPETVVLQVDAGDAAQPHIYSLLRDTAHRKVSSLLRENAELDPANHRLTVVPGILGAYPNALWRVPVADLPALAHALAGLRSERDYRALADRWAVRRTHPRFWQYSDALMEARTRVAPAETGLLDWNRLENR